MKHDPIVNEIHQIRQKILDDCNDDLETLLNRLKAAEQQDQNRVISLASLQEKESLQENKVP